MLFPFVAVFLEVAALPDGGAWVRSDASVQRFAADGTSRAMWHGAEALAVVGDAVLLLEAEALTAFAADAVTPTPRTHITLTPVVGTAGRPGQIWPLAAQRALVTRACANARAWGDDCTELLAVDLATATVTTSQFAARFSHIVSDGRGGAWAAVERGSGSTREFGVAHVGAEGWRLWGYSEFAIDGMTFAGTTRAVPSSLLATGDGGAIAVAQERMWTLDVNGTTSERARPDVTLRELNDIKAAALDTNGVVLLAGYYPDAATHDLRREHDDPSPLLRFVGRDGREQRTRRVETPAWWRHEHRFGTPEAKLAIAGGSTWVVLPDLVLRERAGTWQVVAAMAPLEPADTRRPIWSGSVRLGGVRTYSDAPTDTGFAFAARVERLSGANSRTPDFAYGGYAEYAALAGRSSFGAGVTAGWLRKTALLSLGGALTQVGDRWAPQAVASLFLGINYVMPTTALRFPLGARLDVRAGADATLVTIGIEFDVLIVAALIGVRSMRE